MRIGLVTIFGVPNYGSVLQAYATQKVLERLGHECVIINYDHYKAQMLKGRKRLINKFKLLALDYIPNLKTSKLRLFRKKYLHFSETFDSLVSIERNDWSSFDAFVSGSDQVWNVKYIKDNSIYLLSFVPKEKPRYSISSSFALNKIPEEYVPLYKKELSKFAALSVRESNGVRIINHDLNIKREVKVTLDPTLMLNKNQWLELVKSNKKRKPYILVYLWTYAFEPRPYFERVVEHFQKKTGYEVRVLEGHRFLNELHVPFIDNNRSSIFDFLSLFSSASLVVTSSFHGTAFAVNFGIPLISIVPNGNSDDRQTTLLESLQLQNCIVRVGDNISRISPNYDVNIEQRSLEFLRCESINWIKEILSENIQKD